MYSSADLPKRPSSTSAFTSLSRAAVDPDRPRFHSDNIATFHMSSLDSALPPKERLGRIQSLRDRRTITRYFCRRAAEESCPEPFLRAPCPKLAFYRSCSPVETPRKLSEQLNSHVRADSLDDCMYAPEPKLEPQNDTTDALMDFLEIMTTSGYTNLPEPRPYWSAYMDDAMEKQAESPESVVYLQPLPDINLLTSIPRPPILPSPVVRTQNPLPHDSGFSPMGRFSRFGMENDDRRIPLARSVASGGPELGIKFRPRSLSLVARPRRITLVF